MDPITAALSRASIAAPPARRGRPGLWDALYPVFDRLMQRNFNQAAAVRWMIAEGVVEEADFGRAYQSMNKLRNNDVRFAELNAAGEVGETE